jgi:peptide/nickel transport system permease protein
VTAVAHDVEATVPVPASRRRPRLSGRLGVGLVMLALVILVSLLGPVVSPHETDEIAAPDALTGPSADHWLGADNFGRDMFVRMAVGYRISLEVAVAAVAIGMLGGVPLGLIAGYGGGVIDAVIMRPLDVLMAFPAILLAITVMAIAGSGLGVLIIAIGVVYVPIIARVMRASTLETSQQQFVEAARARGASRGRVLLRHVLPNSIGPVIVQASILLGIGVLLEAALSFIGLGVKPPTPSLGVMLAEGREFMSTSTWIVAVPGVAIMVLVLTFNLIGDGLHAWLDPRGTTRLR